MDWGIDSELDNIPEFVLPVFSILYVALILIVFSNLLFEYLYTIRTSSLSPDGFMSSILQSTHPVPINATATAPTTSSPFSFFFSSTTLAGAFGGLLASAIGKMDGMKGYRGWRWVFIIGMLLSGHLQPDELISFHRGRVHLPRRCRIFLRDLRFS